jgi:pimeloyl-ACP methyl ester carboxylesterase
MVFLLRRLERLSTMTTGKIELRDGRELAYEDIGDSRGYPIVHCHGTPSSRLELGYFASRFATAGFRVVMPDRPGIGKSSPCPGTTLAGWAADMTDLVDALGLDRFVVSGLSGGSPYAATCCALLGDRVVGGMISGGDPDLSWSGARDGYVPLELALIDAPDEEAALALCSEAIGPDGSGFLESDALEWPAPDLAMFDDATFVGHLSAVVSEGFRQGIAGYVNDVRVKGRPWPFDPGAMPVPITIVHGSEDTIVPVQHARLAAHRLRGAELRILAGHGHVSTIPEWPPILAELVSGRTS